MNYMITILLVNAVCFNEKIKVEKMKRLYTGKYEVNDNVENLKRELKNHILSNKGDGFSFDIYEYEELLVIQVELFTNIEEDISQEFGYIVEFFKQYQTNRKLGISNILSSDKVNVTLNQVVSLVVDKEEKNPLEEIAKESYKRHVVFERGSSSDYIELISWIGENVSWDIISALAGTKLNDFYSKFIKNNKDLTIEIEEYLYDKFQYSKAHLKIIDIDYEDQNTVKVIYLHKTKDEVITILWNKKRGLQHFTNESVSDEKNIGNDR